MLNENDKLFNFSSDEILNEDNEKSDFKIKGGFSITLVKITKFFTVESVCY